MTVWTGTGPPARRRPDCTSERRIRAVVELRRDARAAAFWDATPPSYRKTCAFWIADGKRPQTTAARLSELIAACAQGHRLPRFTREKKPPSPGG